MQTAIAALSQRVQGRLWAVFAMQVSEATILSLRKYAGIACCLEIAYPRYHKTLTLDGRISSITLHSTNYNRAINDERRKVDAG